MGLKLILLFMLLMAVTVVGRTFHHHRNPRDYDVVELMEYICGGQKHKEGHCPLLKYLDIENKHLILNQSAVFEDIDDDIRNAAKGTLANVVRKKFCCTSYGKFKGQHDLDCLTCYDRGLEVDIVSGFPDNGYKLLDAAYQIPELHFYIEPLKDWLKMYEKADKTKYISYEPVEEFVQQVHHYKKQIREVLRGDRKGPKPVYRGAAYWNAMREFEERMEAG